MAIPPSKQTVSLLNKMNLKKLLIIPSFLLLTSFSNPLLLAERGCCSWHDGVCGCSASGRQVCCDGSLSPSCTCYVPPKQTFNPTPFPTYQPIYKPSPTPVILINNDPDQTPYLLNLLKPVTIGLTGLLIFLVYKLIKMFKSH